MFEQNAGLVVSDQAHLGDPLFQFLDVKEPSTTFATAADLAWLARRLVQCEARLALLEQQTPLAYWTRFLGWLRGLWPWR